MAIDTNGLLNKGLDTALATIENNPLAVAAGAVVGGLALGVGTGALIRTTVKRKNKRGKRKSSRKRGSRIKHTKRGLAQDRKRRSKQKWEVAYQKRKKKRSRSGSKRRGKVYYARKTGQPYIILSSGKAKFVKGKRRNR
jgi:hypothetical protein